MWPLCRSYSQTTVHTTVETGTLGAGALGFGRGVWGAGIGGVAFVLDKVLCVHLGKVGQDLHITKI